MGRRRGGWGGAIGRTPPPSRVERRPAAAPRGTPAAPPAARGAPQRPTRVLPGEPANRLSPGRAPGSAVRPAPLPAQRPAGRERAHP